MILLLYYDMNELTNAFVVLYISYGTVPGNLKFQQLMDKIHFTYNYNTLLVHTSTKRGTVLCKIPYI